MPARPAPRSSRAARPWRAVVVGLALCLVAVLLGADPATAGPSGTTPATTPARPRLATPVLSARRLPGLMRSRIADQRLDKDVKALLDTAPPTSCLAVTDHGRPVLRANADVPVEPASVNKLLTGAALLDAFGPDAHLTTSVVARSAPVDGVVSGDVWVVGGGDPILTTPGYKAAFEYQDQTVNEYARLADGLRAAGITRIDGGVIGDEGRYDQQRSVPTWPSRYTRSDTVGPLSALIVNDGVTGYSADPDKPSTVRKPGDPPTLAADTLKSYLAQRGITVAGGASAGAAPAGAVELAHLDSLPLRDLLTEMESFSDNTTAELLTKELGRKASGVGSTAAGTQAVRAFLDAQHLPTAGLVLNDGSGLDEGNRLTCDLVAAVLDRAGPDSPLAASLAVAGQRGTLRKRIRTLDGKVHAKTGTLTTPPVASLAGFVTTAGGSELTFAFIQNGLKTDANLADQLAVVLASYPQAPDLSVLGPKPPTTA